VGGFPGILGLRTPLPAVILSDEDGGLYTIEEMKQTDKILNEVYTKQRAGIITNVLIIGST